VAAAPTPKAAAIACCRTKPKTLLINVAAATMPAIPAKEREGFWSCCVTNITRQLLQSAYFKTFNLKSRSLSGKF
jgi:hypothetical protein